MTSHPLAPPKTQVRRATIDDLELVVALRLALLREHGGNAIYGRLRSDAEERGRRIFAAQLQSPTEVIFLAEHDHAAVGILRCIDTVGSPLLEPARYGYVSSVYVRPRARRRGVLRLLLEAAEEWSRARGLTELRLHNASDNPEANAAWQGLGFGIVEHVRMRKIRQR